MCLPTLRRELEEAEAVLVDCQAACKVATGHRTAPAWRELAATITLAAQIRADIAMLEREETA